MESWDGGDRPRDDGEATFDRNGGGSGGWAGRAPSTEWAQRWGSEGKIIGIQRTVPPVPTLSNPHLEGAGDWAQVGDTHKSKGNPRRHKTVGPKRLPPRWGMDRGIGGWNIVLWNHPMRRPFQRGKGANTIPQSYCGNHAPDATCDFVPTNIMANSKAEDQRETPVSPLSAVSPRVPRSPSGTRCMASPLGWPPGAAASPTHPGAGSSPQTHSNTNVIFDFFGYFCPRGGGGDKKTSSRVVSTNLCGKKKA